MTLDEFLAVLDGYEGQVPLQDLESLVRDLEINVDIVRDYVHFGDDCYQRNRIRKGDAYEALILCWKNGQRSPIHDHRGSSCCVRVLEGELIETQFEHAPNGLIFATKSQSMTSGEACASVDADIHQISNLQAGDECLITLHVYSPPLGPIGLYSLEDAKVREMVEPVFEFADGAGI